MINKKMTLLFDACNSGNVAYILNNLDFENINYTYCDKRTLLHIACLNNDNLMIDAILKFLPDTNKIDKNGMLPIYYLIKNNNLKYVRELIEHANCALVNDRLFEALVICCLYDNVEIFDYLYKTIKFDLYISDEHNNNILMYTVKYGSQKLFNYLIKNKFDLNKKNDEGNNVLFFSIVSNNYSSFKYISDKVDINYSNVHGMNALMYSILYNRLTIFIDLLLMGANINCFDLNNNNLLHYAILNERIEFIPSILDKDIKLINYENNDGLTPIDLINKINNEKFKLELIKLFNLNNIDITKKDNLDNQIINENISDITINSQLNVENSSEKLLMNENVSDEKIVHDNSNKEEIVMNNLIEEAINDISEMINENEYILSNNTKEKIIESNIIIENNNEELDNNLDSYNEEITDIENDDEVNKIDDQYIIHDEINDDYFSSKINLCNENNNEFNNEIESSKENNEAIDYLSIYDKKNYRNTYNKIDTTKVEQKSEEKMSKIGNTNIKWLLNENEFNRIINEQKDTYMSTTVKISPVIYFSKIGKTKELFNILKEDGRKAHDKTSTGKTALMYASQYNNFNCARLLILVGANLNAIDENGSTALHYATYMGNYDLVKLLVDNGANTSAQDVNGVSALDIALKQENEKISKLLISTSKEGVINPTKKIILSEAEYI